ncbi:hypothetical protein M5D10_12185 [Leptospira santarosai]|uniref:hypothetical protein n=1 Tax=Leptospira santarosai TaxID=28183 RepID=UPI0022A92C69|nr:hypothetical protein [Leptospira santarosai]UZN06566.1 hypothetical protein M5D10_12185 [Leptospira santarosai]
MMRSPSTETFVAATTFLPHSIGTPQEPRVIVKKYTQTGTEPWTKELNLGGNLAPPFG